MTNPGVEVHVCGTIGRGDFTTPVALTVGSGDTVIVRGPNGSGKTTLLRTIAGLEALVAGELRLDGRRVDSAKPSEFVAPHERRVGFAFQEPRLFTHLSVLANVEFGLRCSGVGRPESTQRAYSALAATGADQLANLGPAELSGGQAQRVGLARAIASEAPLLLVDEPLSAVDDAIRDEIRDLIANHWATTIWVTHADPQSLPSGTSLLRLN